MLSLIQHLQLLLCIESPYTIFSIPKPISCPLINLSAVLFRSICFTKFNVPISNQEYPILYFPCLVNMYIYAPSNGVRVLSNTNRNVRHLTASNLWLATTSIYSLSLPQILSPSRQSTSYLSIQPTLAADGSVFLCAAQPIEAAVLSDPPPRGEHFRVTCRSQPKCR
jgi:hypothetical protein